MAITVFIALTALILAPCRTQIIYPDEYEMLKSSTPLPYTYRRFQYPTSAILPANSASGVAPQQLSHNTLASFGARQASPPAFAYAANPSIDFTTRPPGIPSPNLPQNWSVQAYEAIHRGITKFALDLNKAIYNTRPDSMSAYPENIVFSPLSIATTLAMVLLGSAGQTFTELAKVLGLDMGTLDVNTNSEAYHETFGTLLFILQNYRNAGAAGPQVNAANGIFVQEGYPIRSEYASISRRVYKSEAINLNFFSRGKEAQDIINAWVRANTKEKIPSILSDIPAPDVSVIIASALYFNGEWNQHFIQGATRRKTFFVEPNLPMDVDMMYNGGSFPFFEDKNLGVKILELPYKGLDLSMYIMLPKAEGAAALRAFESQLTVDTIEYLIQNLRNQTCIIGLPRMKLTGSLSLRKAMNALGLSSLFQATAADLSLLSPGYNERSVPPNGPSTGTQPPPTPTPAIDRTSKGSDVFVFPRFGDGDDRRPGIMRNYFRYEDKVHGYSVQQWSTGFSIQRLRSARDTSRSGGANVLRRRRRRQIATLTDEDFYRILAAENFSPLGIDNLRNSGTLTRPILYADSILHKVVIDVNEKGTEAAAATAVLLERDGNQKRLVANRPFLFFIRHNPSKLMLFWGSINTPTPNYPTG